MKLTSLRNRLFLLPALALLPWIGQAQSSGTIISTTTASNIATAGSSNLVVDADVTLSGAADNITQASVSISAGFQTGDVLGFSSTLATAAGVSGSFLSSTGVLTFTGTATRAQYQALLRSVTISLSSSSAVTRGVTYTVGDLISFSNGHYYKFISGAYSWTGAYADASTLARKYYGLTGYLATITSADENAFIKQKLTSDGWIGASDDYQYITGSTTYASQAGTTPSEGHWYWVTGPEKGTNFSNNNGSPAVVSGKYMNWNTGEPNNSSSSEHYGEIFSTGTGQWNDLPNSSTLGYVIEYGGLSGDPALQFSASRNVVVQATSISGANSPGTYYPRAAAKVVDPTLAISSITNITNAQVSVANGFTTGDTLAYTGTLPSGMSSAYNGVTGVLSFTGTATPAQFQTLLRTVTFSAKRGGNTPRNITFSLGNLVAYSNGHFYQYVTSAAISWASAKAAAAASTYQGVPGYLATLTSDAENTFVTQKLSSDGWIGASDDYNQINLATGVTTYSAQAAPGGAEGHWYWVTGPEKGTLFTNVVSSVVSAANGQYMNWNAGEPNNAGIPDENYAQIYASSSVGKWNDLNGTAQNGYVVEFGGQANDPILTLSSNSQIITGSALPVKEIDLSATPEGRHVVVRWKALNEHAVASYSVERAADAKSFKQIAVVASVGDGDHDYLVNDEAPLPGTAYYRVKNLDLGGGESYSPIVRVDRNGSDAISVFPNPAHGSLHIHRMNAAPAAASCYDATGKLVRSVALTGTDATIDISMLPAGAYHLVVGEGESSQIQSFIKQ